MGFIAKDIGIDRRLIYVSMVLIIVFGLLLEYSKEMISSTLVVYLIILVAFGNIAYLYYKNPQSS